MKQFKKQVLLVLCVAACLFGLTACTKAEEGSSMDAADAQALEANTQTVLESLVEIPETDMARVIGQYRDNDMEAMAAGLEGYLGVKGDLGAYVSTEGGTARKLEDGYSITLDAIFEKRRCEFTITLDKQMTTITSLSFNPAYTLGENMTKAALNTLMGMGTVFLVLIFISWLISCFRYINLLEEKMNKKKAPAPAPKRTRPETSPAPAPVPAVNLTDDLELVAVITAAIAAAEGTPADGLVVRSIRRAPAGSWKKQARA